VARVGIDDLGTSLTEIASSSAALLTVAGLTIRFGGIAALSDVSFTVAEGEITGLIGPNGAGKTTCFNCITGLYRPTSGTIALRGEDLLGLPAYRIVRHGIARTFQNLELFGTMSVLDNVLVGFGARARNGAAHDAEREAREILVYVGLGEVARRSVHALPFGARKMVELARALAAKPQLLLLDEPAAGFGHEEVERLAETIKSIQRDFKTTILLVEHHMQLVMRVCDRIIVLSSGRKLAEGNPASIAANHEVIDAYLGTV
jgi:branched-chain amino acid transport system ATP-binding protein